jgi:hypothetical protein
MPKRSPKGLIWAGIAFCILGIANAVALNVFLPDSKWAKWGPECIISGFILGIRAIRKGYVRLQQEKTQT